ncbi:hypothetical protein OEZ85_006027 [Tetradesmus obliquus]|uniref:Uncharacterized protein n=1 Tax=Tetradesmus obliquus TaxID=3088 RepID=A0ABY8UGK6_TETOB|nr:hypothetical protein OEZ85_006027 [Tetradesmus obliquus]
MFRDNKGKHAARAWPGVVSAAAVPSMQAAPTSPTTPLRCTTTNTAMDGNGGALALVPYSDSHSSSPVTSSFTATRLLTFTQNFAAGVPWHAPEMSIAGGALFLQASSALFGGGASFSGNQAVPEGKGLGGAVCAESNSSIIFGAKTSFLHNKAWSGGTTTRLTAGAPGMPQPQAL